MVNLLNHLRKAICFAAALRYRFQSTTGNRSRASSLEIELQAFDRGVLLKLILYRVSRLNKEGVG
ncbi:hypothetical protein AVDCRST_MAG92-2981 [uncultured Coleofasciculus sp.]|uniref:Uncharacterized protein n=1 Tax=uncultured Coleofasciculus sp. TaxID=1267456 RepID=A0A6J4J960_9CYAN|nr:hypothetical protein AVDCRST_MAG92-2981 [uncultured Coleofasciculus sp.]